MQSTTLAVELLLFLKFSPESHYLPFSSQNVPQYGKKVTHFVSKNIQKPPFQVENAPELSKSTVK